MQLWAKTVLSSLKWTQAAVVPDSYAGVFPPGSQGPLVKSYGLCTWNKLDASLVTKCNNGVLTLQDIDNVNQNANPNIPYSFIQSKVDSVQVN